MVSWLGVTGSDSGATFIEIPLQGFERLKSKINSYPAHYPV
jgi:hypothetical protein